MSTTEQVRKIPNPTGKGGFQERPQDRNPGGWIKSDTPRYKLEQMMKLSDEEIEEVINDSNAPKFEKKLAEALRDGNWNVIREMIDQVYGKAKESVDVTTQGESINPYAALTTEELRKLAGK